MSTPSETTPLTEKWKQSPPQSKYYFMNKERLSNADEFEEEILPAGTQQQDFRSRKIGKSTKKSSFRSGGAGGKHGIFNTVKDFFMNGNESRKRQSPQPNRAPMKQRRVPIKVEPKVFFANERTFLAWLHTSVTLAGISVAIVGMAGEGSKVYGLTILPVAIAFIMYALFQYTRRASMIKRKEPGPYEDLVGPVVLAVMLMAGIFLNFMVKFVELWKDEDDDDDDA